MKNTEPKCRVVVPLGATTGKQGLAYEVGISATTAGAEALHMQLLRMPPRSAGKAHRHDGHETAIYLLSGISGCYFGERLSEHAWIEPGQFFYIPAGVPHFPYNPSTTEDVVAVIARTDSNEQESVTLLPDLDRLPQVSMLQAVRKDA